MEPGYLKPRRQPSWITSAMRQVADTTTNLNILFGILQYLPHKTLWRKQLCTRTTHNLRAIRFELDQHEEAIPQNSLAIANAIISATSALDPPRFEISEAETHLEPSVLLGLLNERFRSIPFDRWVKYALGYDAIPIRDFIFGVETFKRGVYSHGNPAERIALCSSTSLCLIITSPPGLPVEHLLRPIRTVFLEDDIVSIIQKLRVLEMRYRDTSFDWWNQTSTDFDFLLRLQHETPHGLACSITEADRDDFNRYTPGELQDAQQTPIGYRWQKLSDEVKECAKGFVHLRQNLVELALFLYHLRNYHSLTAVLAGLDFTGLLQAESDSRKRLLGVDRFLRLERNYELYREHAVQESALPWLFPVVRQFRMCGNQLEMQQISSRLFSQIATYSLKNVNRMDRTIVVLGAAGVGKSTWLAKLLYGPQFKDPLPQTGSVHHKIVFIDGQSHQLSFTEAPCLNSSSVKVDAALRERADCFIILYSTVSSKSFEIACETLDRIRALSSGVSAPTLVVANKFDRVADASGPRLSQMFNTTFVEISVIHASSCLLEESIQSLIQQPSNTRKIHSETSTHQRSPECAKGETVDVKSHGGRQNATNSSPESAIGYIADVHDDVHDEEHNTISSFSTTPPKHGLRMVQSLKNIRSLVKVSRNKLHPATVHATV